MTEVDAKGMLCKKTNERVGFQILAQPIEQHEQAHACKVVHGRIVIYRMMGESQEEQR